MSSVEIQVPSFLSIYALKVGERKPRQKGSPRGELIEWKRKPVEVSVLATAIKECGISHIDRFTRFMTANPSQQKRVLSALEEYVEIVNWGEDPYEVQRYKCNLIETDAFREWHTFGWEEKSLPNFTATYKAFHEQKEEKPPKASAKVYGMIAGYLKLSLSQDDYLDFSTNHAAGDKAAKAALEGLLTQVNETISPKPLSDTLDHTRAFAIRVIKEANKEF